MACDMLINFLYSIVYTDVEYQLFGNTCSYIEKFRIVLTVQVWDIPKEITRSLWLIIDNMSTLVRPNICKYKSKRQRRRSFSSLKIDWHSQQQQQKCAVVIYLNIKNCIWVPATEKVKNGSCQHVDVYIREWMECEQVRENGDLSSHRPSGLT